MEHSVKFDIKILKIIPCGSRSPDKAEKSFHVLQCGTTMKFTKNHYARTEPFFCPFNVLFSDFLVAVVVFLNSLLSLTERLSE